MDPRAACLLLRCTAGLHLSNTAGARARCLHCPLLHRLETGAVHLAKLHCAMTEPLVFITG